jgi:hypothetical protein
VQITKKRPASAVTITLPGSALLPLSCDHLEIAASIQFWMGHFCIWNGAIKSVAEGVGFEPTVGCPTLDFESSALNRTQPPFLWSCGANYRTRRGQSKLR